MRANTKLPPGPFLQLWHWIKDGGLKTFPRISLFVSLTAAKVSAVMTNGPLVSADFLRRRRTDVG